MYDAFTVITKSLSLLIAKSTTAFKHTFRRGDVYNYNRTKGVPCTTDPPIPWMHGTSLMLGMKSVRCNITLTCLRNEYTPLFFHDTVGFCYLGFVISETELSEILQDIRTLAYQICRLEKKIIEQPHFTTEYVIWLLTLEIYWKYCGKEEKLLLLDKRFRDKTKVDYIL